MTRPPGKAFDAAEHAREKPRLLDLFCKAGGAARGYQRAGFYVVGVDIEPQPRYAGDEFVQADALEFMRGVGVWSFVAPFYPFAAIHASPPCQANLKGLAGVNRKIGRAYNHPDLLDVTRHALKATGAPYVIEQPEQGARMVKPVRCCGSSFGLPVRRHRLFESNIQLEGATCAHDRFTEKKYWTGWVKNGERQLSTVVQVYGNGANRHEWGPALGIDWMTAEELTQAIPPDYTHHIGAQLLAYTERRNAA